MLHRQAEVRIERLRAGARLACGNHDEATVDLLPPVHARRILLADEAALGEADAVQLGGIAFEPEDVAQLRATLADSEAEAVFEPAFRRISRGSEPPAAELRKTRIGHALLAVRAPVDGQAIIPLDRDWPAKAIDAQPLDQVRGGFGLAVEEEIFAVCPDDEIEQTFALWRQQAGPDRQVLGDIARDQPLEEAVHVLSGQTDDGAIGEGGGGHVHQLESRRAKTNPFVSSEVETRATRGRPSTSLGTNGVKLDTPDRITIRRPDDWHLHLRDGEMLKAVVPYSARQFARAIIMPNLSPPVTSVAAAAAYRERIIAAAGPGFTPLMTCYLTDDASPDEIARGHAEGVWVAAKLYPAGATTNSANGVTNVRNIYPALERMQAIGMPLLVHGEVTDPEVDIFDREAVFIDGVLQPMMRDIPELKIVFEHITTADAAQFVADGPENIAATVTPQHLIINRNAIFAGGIRPHAYCLPVAKRERHRLAVRAAAVSGSSKFFLGTDSAPHLREAKESSCGCAGIFNAPFALESYAAVFDEEGALDRLEAFASENGPRFYGLPLNEGTVTLERTEVEVPESVPAAGSSLVPFHAGERLGWRMVA